MNMTNTAGAGQEATPLKNCSEETRLDIMLSLLLTLLDRIELEEDYTLAGQRHQIARDCGYTVVFRERSSGQLQ